MGRKKLEEFLNLSDEEFEFVNSVRNNINAILEHKFDVWDIRVGIGIFDVLVYVCGKTLVYRLYADNAIEIFRTNTEDVPLTDIGMKINNNEIYNNIVDKLNEKNKNYLFVKLLELTKIED
jgi:hypothetical protein